MGGPVEGWPLEKVAELRGGLVTDLLPYIRPVTDSDGIVDWKEVGEWKISRPAGSTTDDTHFKNYLCQAIVTKGSRIEAEDFARELPEQDPFAWVVMRMALTRLAAIKRGFLAEHTTPSHIPLMDTAAHHGGKGLPPANGAVMMISPVGLLYPGQPRQAYLAGYEIACTVQQGYAADMAGVVATGVAAAMIPETSIESVFDAMVDVAPSAAVAMLKETRELAEAATDIKDFRQAWQDKLAVHFLDPGESVSVAAGCLLLGKGDFAQSTLNAVNYGRDCDSIATVAGAVAGAFQGIEAIPSKWIETVDESRGEELDQGDLARGIYKALTNELRQASEWADQYEALK